MKKRFTLLLIAAIAVAFVLPAIADEHKEKTGCSKMSEKMVKCECMDKLNLTEKQKEEISAMKKSFMEQKAKQHEEMAKICASVKELLNADKPDMAAIEKKIDEQAKLWIKGKKEMIEHQLKVRSLLTPEQLKIWKEHKASCKMGHMDKMMKHECKGHEKMEGAGAMHEGCKKGAEMKKHDCKEGKEAAGCESHVSCEKTDK